MPHVIAIAMVSACWLLLSLLLSTMYMIPRPTSENHRRNEPPPKLFLSPTADTVATFSGVAHARFDSGQNPATYEEWLWWGLHFGCRNFCYYDIFIYSICASIHSILGGGGLVSTIKRFGCRSRKEKPKKCKVINS